MHTFCFSGAKITAKWKKLTAWCSWAHSPQTFWCLRIDDVTLPVTSLSPNQRIVHKLIAHPVTCPSLTWLLKLLCWNTSRSLGFCGGTSHPFSMCGPAMNLFLPQTAVFRFVWPHCASGRGTWAWETICRSQWLRWAQAWGTWEASVHERIQCACSQDWELLLQATHPCLRKMRGNWPQQVRKSAGIRPQKRPEEAVAPCQPVSPPPTRCGLDCPHPQVGTSIWTIAVVLTHPQRIRKEGIYEKACQPLSLNKGQSEWCSNSQVSLSPISHLAVGF